MSEPEKKYQIEVTAKQLRVLVGATEVYGRLGLGQFWTILEHICTKPFSRFNEEFVDARDTLNRMGAAFLDMPPSSGPGIFNPDVHARHKIAWDMHQVFRHRLSWDTNPKGDITVNFDDPLKTSEEPLAKIAEQEVPPSSDKA